MVSAPLPHLFPRLHQLLDCPRAGEMPWPDATDEVRALIEILHSRLAHHREAALQVNQILSAEHHARRPGTAGHDREMVSRWENIRPLSPLQENTSRCPLQDPRPGWIRYFLSCRALAYLQDAGLARRTPRSPSLGAIAVDPIGTTTQPGPKRRSRLFCDLCNGAPPFPLPDVPYICAPIE